MLAPMGLRLSEAITSMLSDATSEIRFGVMIRSVRMTIRYRPAVTVEAGVGTPEQVS